MALARRNDTMKIALIGSTGLLRCPTPLFERIDRANGIDAKGVVFGRIPFFELQTLMMDLSGYDIVHNMSDFPTFCRLNSKQVFVTTAHEMQPVLYPELNTVNRYTVRDRLWQIIKEKYGTKAMIKSDYVIANSKLTASGVVAAGMPKDRVFATPFGIEKEFLRKPLSAHKKGKKFKVGTVATMSAHKNTFFSIDSFRKVKGDDFEFEFWGGSNYPLNVVEQRINGDKRIKLKGFAPERELVNVYDSFDVLAFPSLFEGFGIPIIEGKARGLPVIIYKRGHYDSDVKKYCFEAEDEDDMAAIIERLKENGYNEKTRKKALEDARQYTWERTAKLTIEAYRKMI